MKLKFTFTSICLLLVAIPVLLIAAKPPVVKWTVKDPLEQKVFVENKGQYVLPDKNLNSKDILYGANVGGLQYYFTKTGIWINYAKPVKRTEQEIAQLKSQLESIGIAVDEKKIENKFVTEYHQMSFLNANPKVEIASDNQASGNYNFGTISGSSIIAHAYKKLTYYNLYSGIDMEIYFPDGKDGFEYDFIVHPGADVSQIKIQYPLNAGLSLNEEGNVIIKSVYGEFTDHAPVASQAQTSNSITCSFVLNQGIVQFKAAGYDRNKNLKIDPWQVLTFPASFTVNDGYYVDFDDAGNCYVYGGSYPWTLAKYNSAGTYLWEFTNAFTTPPSVNPYIANFGVDRASQSVYMIEAFNESGSRMDKLNSAGTQIATYAGSTNIIEMWRIAFSRCNVHQAVVGGGNISGGPYNSAFYLDTTLSSFTPVNVLGSGSGYNDVCLLTLDNTTPQSNSYIGFCGNGGAVANFLLKVPTQVASPYLAAYTWKVKDNYDFVTASSVVVGSSPGAVSFPLGFSGETYGTGNDLFTYDSYTLEKWNAATGALVASKVINTNANGESHMYWAGLNSDVCDHIFLGSKTNILEYDGNLNLLNTIASPATTDTVYDVKLGNYNILYACGQNFLEALQFDTLQLPFCNPFHGDTAITNATCTTLGSATVTPDPEVNGHVYSAKWSNGQTGFTATNLEAGTDTITITDSSCMVEQIKVTVVIKKIATYPNVTINNVHTCLGVPVTVTANSTTPGVVYTWSPSTGLSATTGSSVTANPTVTTSYTVVATVPNSTYCPDTIYPVVVTIDTLPTIAVTPNPASICEGSSIPLAASGALTYLWLPRTGLNTSIGTTVTASPTVTSTYTVTGVNGNGCVDSTSITVTVNQYPVVSFTPDSEAICNGKSTPLTATGATTYTWQGNPAGLSDTTSSGTATASPAATTTYSVYGITNGCATKALDTVTVLPLPTVVIEALAQTKYCVDASAVQLTGSTPTGGVYSGNGINDTTFTPSAAGVGGPYTITYTYTSPNGCINSDSESLTVEPLPTITILPAKPVICSGNPVTLTASGAVTYSWDPNTNLTLVSDSSVQVSPTTPTAYTSVGTDVNGCVDSSSVVVGIGTLPKVAFNMLVPNQCNPLLLQFSASVFDTGVTYLWEFGDGSIAPGITPQHLYAKGAIDTIKLIETNSEGCIDSTDSIRQVESLTETALLPNAFTPGAAENEFFKPQIQCDNVSGYIFRIYNRWGEMVYESNSASDPGWAGTYNGKAEPVGVYVYYLEFNCGGCPISRKGNITLIR